jgi:hypothetical protein
MKLVELMETGMMLYKECVLGETWVVLMGKVWVLGEAKDQSLTLTFHRYFNFRSWMLVSLSESKPPDSFIQIITQYSITVNRISNYQIDSMLIEIADGLTEPTPRAPTTCSHPGLSSGG